VLFKEEDFWGKSSKTNCGGKAGQAAADNN
jgi:hypothetical protein